MPLYYTIKIPNIYSATLWQNVAWDDKFRIAENMRKFSWVEKVVDFKNWYMAELESYLVKNFGLKRTKAKTSASPLRNIVNLAFRAFLSTTIYGQLAYTGMKVFQEEGFPNPFGKKTPEFDIADLLDNFGFEYNSGEHSISISPTWELWKKRAYWLENGNANIKPTQFLSKMKDSADKKAKQMGIF